VDRSLQAGIGAALALAAGCSGFFVLPPAHDLTPGGRAMGVPRLETMAMRLPSRGPGPYRQASPRSSTPSPVLLPRARSGHVFIGVAVKGSIGPGVRSFSRATGARMSMVEIYTRFGTPFPRLELRRVGSAGATPLMQWNPRGSPLGRIAAGRYDTYLRDYAVSVRKFGRRIVLSFGHEMNGTWNSWGAGHVSPATFVAAWRRIHRVFARAGVHNVTWSWDPSHVGELPRPWWPGRHYVGKIGIDGYLRPGDTFAHIFADRLAYIRRFTSKPVYIAETAVAPSRYQTRQITGLFDGVQRFHLSGFVWFDINHLAAWRLEGRRAAVRAFRRAAARINR